MIWPVTNVTANPLSGVFEFAILSTVRKRTTLFCPSVNASRPVGVHSDVFSACGFAGVLKSHPYP